MSPSFTILHDLLAVPPAPTDLATPLPDDIATVVVAGLKAEVDRCWATDLDRSLQVAEYITAIGQARGDLSQIALGTMARGDTYNIKGDKRHAAEYLARAADLFLQADDEIGWARTRIGFIALSVDTGEIEQAFADAERARQIFLTHGKDDLRLRLAINTAFTYIHIGKHQHAHDTLLTALALAEQIGPSAEIFLSIIYTNLGFTSERAGEIDAASQYHQHAFRIADQRRDVLNAINARNNQAALDNLTGNYKRALRTATEARDLLRESASQTYAHSLYLIGHAYAELGRWEDVLAITNEAAEIFHRHSAKLYSGLLMRLRAQSLSETGHYALALQYAEQAEAGLAHLQYSAWLPAVQSLKAVIHLGMGNLKSAQDIAAKLQAAPGIARGEALNLQARIELASGNLELATQYGHELLEFDRVNHLLHLHFCGHHQVGIARQRLGQTHRARRHFQAAMAAITRSQSGLTVAMRPGFLQDKLGAFHSLMHLELERNAAAAFTTLERMKSQTWLHYVLNHDDLVWRADDPASRDLQLRLNQLRHQHQWHYEQLFGLHTAGNSLPDLDRSALRAKLSSLESELRRVTETLYLHTGEADRQFNKGVDLPQMQNRLRAGEVLLAYYDNGEEVIGFTFTPNGLTATTLPITHNQLAKLVNQVRFNIAAALRAGPISPQGLILSAILQRIATDLYTRLIEPLVNRLSDYSLLTVVPYGQLHLLPFHLLHTGTAYLGQSIDLTILPSASLLTRAKLAQPRGALAIAVSENGLLPETLVEVRMVEQTLGGRVLTDGQVHRGVFDRPPVQVLHIAAHGEHRLDRPELSYISLGSEQLYTDDLFQLDLRYELVTLSACETGLATIAPGDELVGLGRGFLFSGAESLLTTLWPVPDNSARDWMSTFYTAIARGEPKSRAYRMAQQAAAAAQPQIHPAFWSAFQLIGNPDPLTDLP